MPTPLPRLKVKKQQTWNSESVFATPEAFEAEVTSLLESLPEAKKFQGHLGESIERFLAAMQMMDTLDRRASKVRVYASMSSSVDANDPSAAAMNGKR